MNDSMIDALERDSTEPTPPPADEASFQVLQAYALELESLKEEEDALKSALKLVTSRVSELRLKKIPDLMQALHLTDAAGRGNFTLPSGAKVSLRTDFYAGIDKDRETETFDWLRRSGFGDLIRETVHPQTLKAFLRDQIEQGHEPPAFFKTHFETSAILTRPKGA